MERVFDCINKLMVDVFNDILRIEELAVKRGAFRDISITEMHTVEAVGLHGQKNMTDVAKRLGITVGTLTTAISNLVKKGYVERIKSEADRRVVNIMLTKRGRLLFRMHEKFHRNLIEDVINTLDEDECNVLTKALTQMHAFFLVKQ